MGSSELADGVATNREAACARMREVLVPEAVLAVARCLHEAGHEAVLVGGAIRDALRGRPQGDWDLATSATPQEVLSLFAKTIPTGLQHGTITVLSGRGDARRAVEVTTFRGEGAYDDGRRPSQVHFLRELEGDLARRDFTINAIAWDPNRATLTDSFGGLEDLRAGLVRAVGDPLERFREDGLRTMRAVRFAATLGFALDPATEAAIPAALDVFARVSRERVRVELVKLLAAPRPSMGLRPMARTGLWECVLPGTPASERAAAIDACDRLPTDPLLRLARLLHGLEDAPDRLRATIDSLRPSRDERSRVLALLSAEAHSLSAARGEVEIRRAAAKLGRERIEEVGELWEEPAARRREVATACAGAALSVRELALQGRDLIAAGIVAPGPRMGEVLEGLLAWAIEDPARNRGDRLLARARELVEGG